MNIIKLENRDNVTINYKNVCFIERATSGTRFYFVGNSNPVFMEIPYSEAQSNLNYWISL